MTDHILQDAENKFKSALDHLHGEFSKLQTGRASAALVESVVVETYGAAMPLKGLATITIPEHNQIAIQPWDRSQISAIEKALRDANIGMNPQNDGVLIRLFVSPLTEDRRKELVKLVHKYAEESRISIRNARHDALNEWKILEKEKEISGDELRGFEKIIQDKVDDINHKIEEAAKHKEQDVMTV